MNSRMSSFVRKSYARVEAGVLIVRAALLVPAHAGHCRVTSCVLYSLEDDVQPE